MKILHKSHTPKYPPFGQCSPLFGVNCIEEEAAQLVAMMSLRPPAPRTIPSAKNTFASEKTAQVLDLGILVCHHIQ
jgi:hypothetical protein